VPQKYSFPVVKLFTKGSESLVMCLRPTRNGLILRWVVRLHGIKLKLSNGWSVTLCGQRVSEGMRFGFITSPKKGGRGLPHSKTLREVRQVLECSSPLELWGPL
jgi:hypothetical protein